MKRKERESEIFIVAHLATILTHVASRDDSGWVERGR